MSTFSAETYQNEFLPRDGTEVNAIVTIVCEGAPGAVATAPDAAEFVGQSTDSAAGEATSTVVLRLWTPHGATVDAVRQVAPTIEELTDRAVRIDRLTVEYPTGAWGRGERDFHVQLSVEPRRIGDEILVGRIRLVVDDEIAAQALIRAVWTEDEQLSTQIDRAVAHYTGQAELADAIQAGLEALRRADEATAIFEFGRAVQLAHESSNDGTMRLLERVVEIEDAATGAVRVLRPPGGPDDLAEPGVREPRRPTPPRDSGAIQLPPPDNAA
jgi:hypothetical protein